MKLGYGLLCGFLLSQLCTAQAADAPRQPESTPAQTVCLALAQELESLERADGKPMDPDAAEASLMPRLAAHGKLVQPEPDFGKTVDEDRLAASLRPYHISDSLIRSIRWNGNPDGMRGSLSFSLHRFTHGSRLLLIESHQLYMHNTFAAFTLDRSGRAHIAEFAEQAQLEPRRDGYASWAGTVARQPAFVASRLVKQAHSWRASLHLILWQKDKWISACALELIYDMAFGPTQQFCYFRDCGPIRPTAQLDEIVGRFYEAGDLSFLDTSGEAASSGAQPTSSPDAASVAVLPTFGWPAGLLEDEPRGSTYISTRFSEPTGRAFTARDGKRYWLRISPAELFTRDPRGENDRECSRANRCSSQRLESYLVGLFEMKDTEVVPAAGFYYEKWRGRVRSIRQISATHWDQ